jgi:hypothetical protein
MDLEKKSKKLLLVLKRLWLMLHAKEKGLGIEMIEQSMMLLKVGVLIIVGMGGVSKDDNKELD